MSSRYIGEELFTSYQGACTMRQVNRRPIEEAREGDEDDGERRRRRED
jgi:hypothetical protein